MHVLYAVMVASMLATTASAQAQVLMGGPRADSSTSFEGECTFVLLPNQTINFQCLGPEVPTGRHIMTVEGMPTDHPEYAAAKRLVGKTWRCNVNLPYIDFGSCR